MLRGSVTDEGQVFDVEQTHRWSVQVLMGTLSVLCLVGWELFIGIGYPNFICSREWVLYSLLRGHQ